MNNYKIINAIKCIYCGFISEKIYPICLECGVSWKEILTSHQNDLPIEFRSKDIEKKIQDQNTTTSLEWFQGMIKR